MSETRAEALWEALKMSGTYQPPVHDFHVIYSHNTEGLGPNCSGGFQSRPDAEAWALENVVGRLDVAGVWIWEPIKKGCPLAHGDEDKTGEAYEWIDWTIERKQPFWHPITIDQEARQ
jgi:hypothetical protein